MPERKPATKSAHMPAKPTGTTRRASKGFSDEERAAIRDRALEMKAAVRPGRHAGEPDEEGVVLEKIAAMSSTDRAMATRFHAIVKASAPALSPTLWYGMPAYTKAGKVICHFQSAQKFKTRYATVGFSDKANLDEGGLWPVAFAVNELSSAVEARIGALVKQAAS